MKIIHLGVGGFGRNWSEVLHAVENGEVTVAISQQYRYHPPRQTRAELVDRIRLIDHASVY